MAVITAAAEMLSGKICKLSKDRTHYKDPECAEYMRRQLRLVLRMAKDYGHTKVVLGAIGCGAFSHPNREVAKLWLAVFMEEEFKGGWWENVVFAVKDPVNSTMGDGNYAVFFQTLHGVVV